MHAKQKYDTLFSFLRETSLIFLKYIVYIKKFIKRSVKYGGKQLTKAAQNRHWPVIFWTF